MKTYNKFESPVSEVCRRCHDYYQEFGLVTVHLKYLATLYFRIKYGLDQPLEEVKSDCNQPLEEFGTDCSRCSEFSLKDSEQQSRWVEEEVGQLKNKRKSSD